MVNLSYNWYSISKIFCLEVHLQKQTTESYAKHKIDTYLAPVLHYSRTVLVAKTWTIYRYMRKVDCSCCFMCPALALALPRVFLWQPLAVVTRQTRQVVHAINQSIFNMMSMVLTSRKVLSKLNVYGSTTVLPAHNQRH
jgi:hypothetical protein